MPEHPKMQLIETSCSTGARNMAIDEAILEEAIAGRQAPTLRFYHWSPPAVTLGYSLDANRDADPQACRDEGIDLIRRITGGGAVLHLTELTYSVVIPVEMVRGSIADSYRVICGAIASGLGFLKNGFEFSPVNDIIYNGRKVSGSASVRRGGWILQHGTVILELDREKMFRLIRVPEEKLNRHGLESPAQRVCSLGEVMQREVGFDEAADALLRGFVGVFHIDARPAAIPENVSRIADTLEPVYASEEWNFARTRKQRSFTESDVRS